MAPELLQGLKFAQIKVQTQMVQFLIVIFYNFLLTS